MCCSTFRLRQSRRHFPSGDHSALAGGGAMLAKAVESYLALRRAAGFALRCQGSLLGTFDTFSDTKGKHYVCSEIAIEWAGSVPSIFQRARRLDEVIRCARYIRAEDPWHVIPRAVFGSELRRRPV